MLNGVALLGIQAMLGFASSAQALVLTGGPSYTLPGGGSCSVSGTPSLTGGATVSCTGVTLGAHTHVYYGIKNNSNVNGGSTNGAAISGGEIFGYSSSGASSITYTSSTSISSACSTGACATGTDTVSNSLILSQTGGGSTTVVATGAPDGPPDTGNGDIQRLFRLDSGGSFTFNVTINGVDPHYSGELCDDVYDVTHAAAGGGGCGTGVDLAFYWSDCGDGVVDSPEQCDLGSGVNGSSTSCCSAICTYKTAGTECRASTGECDPNETCTGSSPTCPVNAFSSVGTPCTDLTPPPLGNCKDAQCNGSGTCDQNFTNESNGTSCSDSLFCNGTDTCSSGACTVHTGDPCTGPDGDSNCTESCDEAADDCNGPDPNGSACDDGLFCNGTDQCASGACTTHLGDPCPGPDGDTNCAETCNEGLGDCSADDPNGTTCRTAAGLCDIVETCSSGTCPTDAFLTAGTLCRAGSGDSCDPDENCTGSSAACPVDVVTPGGTLCRAGSGDSCDPDENCTGTPTDPCPADVVATAGTVCNAGSGDLCDPDEVCSGTATVPCPSDNIATAGTVCNAGSGDLCDPDEVCSGTADDPCPADNIATAGTVCDAGSGDLCDPDEVCSGTADDPCPADSFEPASTVCRGPAFACDAAEFCPGSPGGACPSDILELDGTSCNDGDPCTQLTTCLAGSCQGGLPDLCVDHFKCYKAKDLKQPKFVKTTVNLVDQFGLIHDDFNFELKKPFLVCNPTDKNGEGVNNPNDHLTCYKVKGGDGRIDKSQRPKVEAHNQLGTVQLELKKAFVVCVPSTKSVIP